MLYDLGEVSSEEPFRRLFNQGYIQAYAYTDARGSYVPAEEVVESPDGGFTWNGAPVTQEYGKMGKSLRNVVTPDEMCERYGADTFRLYEMSTGPMEVSRPWSTRDVVGSQRFLQRVWRNLVDETTGASRVSDDEPDEPETLRLLHRTIAGVHTDFLALHYNTAAAKLIELNNHLTKRGGAVPRSVAEPLVLMLAPLAPHIAEELWSRLGHDATLAYAPFPVADERWLVAETVEYPIQVNGKVRSRVTVPANADGDAVQVAALAEEKIAAAAGRPLAAQGDRRARPAGERRRVSRDAVLAPAAARWSYRAAAARDRPGQTRRAEWNGIVLRSAVFTGCRGLLACTILPLPM